MKEMVFSDRQEREEALDEVMRVAQRDAFQDTINSELKGQKLDGKNPLVAFNPFVDSRGLLRAMGRFTDTDMGLPYSWIYPMLLPSDHELTAKMVLYVHESNQHAGTDTTHAMLRQRYWILKGRATVKRYLSRCIVCRRYNAKKESPRMAPLPKERTAVREPPFTNISLDGMGPLQVKEGEETIKKWLIVFACSLTRAVNIEILDSLTTEAFVRAMRLQFAEFGVAKSVRLDNYRSHIRMANEVASLYESQMMSDAIKKFSDKGIKWSWSSVSQPSTNGIIERMVRCTKECIKKTIHRRLLTREELHLFIKEARRVINNRPLTQVHHGSMDDNIAICPNHLLYGHLLEGLPMAANTDLKSRSKSLSKLWNERQKASKKFTELFTDQYLSEIRKFTKWPQEGNNLKVGDLCILSDPNEKRRDWPLAMVDEIVSEHNGNVSRVRLRTADRFMTRSTRSLVFLKHLPEYEAAGAERGGDADKGDKVDPPRDDLMKFIRRGKRNKEEETVVATCLQKWHTTEGKQDARRGQ